MSWCYVVTCDSVETDDGVGSSTQIGKGETDGACEGKGSKQRD